MGVKGLYTYLKPYRRDTYPQGGAAAASAAQKLRIGFDAMSMLYKYKGQYKEMYPLLNTLKAQGHRLLFVFDGKAPAEKEEEVRERREARQGAVTQATAIKEHLAAGGATTEKERQILEYSVARLEFQGWHMSREIRHEFQKELWRMEIPYVKAIGEADDVLVDLAGAGKLDVVVSTDMDFLLSGVSRIWIPFRKIADGFEEVILWNVLDGESMSPAALCDAGILCGVEPLRGEVSFPVNKAFSWLRYYKSIEAVLASTIQEKQLDVLRDPERLEAVRAHFRAQTPWEGRIRPDHYERTRAFLDPL